MDKDSGRDETKDFLRAAEDEAALEPEEVFEEDSGGDYGGYGANFGGSLSERTRPDGSSLESRRKGFYGEAKEGDSGLKAPGTGGAKRSGGSATSGGSSGASEVGKGVGGLNKAEAGIKYTGGGRAAALANLAQATAKGKFNFKKGGPVITIVGLLMMGMIAVFGATSLMPANLIEQFNDMFDGSYTSRAWRTKAIMRNAMNGGKWNHAVKKQVRRLEKHGISVVSDGEGSEKFHLEYKDSRGNKVTIGAADFDTEYTSNREFRTLYNKATRPVTGRIGAWVDNSLAKFFERHNLSKNVWADWKNKLGDNMKNRLRALRETIEKRRGDLNINEDTQTKSKQEKEPEYDEDGNPTEDPDDDPKIKQDPAESDSGAVKRGGDLEANKTVLTERVKKAAGTVSSKSDALGMITGFGCMIATAASVLSAIQAAITIGDAMEQFQDFAEGSDKARTEDSPYSPVNTLAVDISQPDKEGNTVLNSVALVPTLSAGTQGISSTDDSLALTNMESMYTSISLIPGMNGSVFEVAVGCAVTQLATAAVSFVANVVAIVASGGVAGFVSAALDKVTGKALMGMLLPLLASGALSIFIDHVASTITDNKCNVDQSEADSFEDEDGLSISPSQMKAACFALGGSAMLFGNFHFGGGSAGDQAKVAQEYGARQVALEWEAEVDRENFDPLDVTNKNTFIGSLARSVATPIAQMTTPVGVLGALGGVASSSVASLLPSANAIETAQYVENIKGENCSSAEKVGALADDNCQAIIITDMGTEDIDPDELDKKLIELDAIDENGNPKNNYKKYIEHWVYRETPIGMVDDTVLADETNLRRMVLSDEEANVIWEATGFDVDLIGEILGGILDFIPVFGDLKVGAEAGLQLLALPEAIGQNYVATEGDNEICVDVVEPTYCLDRQGASWNNEYKYYQRAAEDERLMESWDPDYTSKVLVAIEQYEAENPTDNSLEGWLARQTGYPKETISWALTEAEYWTYLADYEAPKLEEEKEFNVHELVPERIEMPEEIVAKAEAYIVYDDLRGRVYTV